MKITWSLLALERVGEIAEYIARDNPSAAEKWVDSVFLKVGKLFTFPESGRHLPEIKRTDLREIVFGNYRIIYRLRSEEITVLTVRHFRQILPPEEVE
jgi:plasmid stabilization system protein ParE